MNKNILNLTDNEMPFGDELVEYQGCYCNKFQIDDLRVPHSELVKNWGQCAAYVYDSNIYPFIAPAIYEKLNGRVLLDHIKTKWFKSSILTNINLNSDFINSPGYNPGNNDEIHNDHIAQYLFHHGDYHCEDKNMSKLDIAKFKIKHENSVQKHSQLKSLVINGSLWYILLHTNRYLHNNFEFADNIVLMALGVCSKTDQIIGVISVNACHNICD